MRTTTRIVPRLFSPLHSRLYVMLLFIIFNDLSQTSYLKIYRTDLRQFFRVGRTVAVDDQSKNSFSIPHGCFHGNQFCWFYPHLRRIFIYVVLYTELIRWTQAARGAAWRANVGLCPAYLVRISSIVPATTRVAWSGGVTCVIVRPSSHLRFQSPNFVALSRDTVLFAD